MEPTSPRRGRLLVLVAAATSLLLVTAACGSDDDSAGTTTTTTVDVCDARTELTASLDDLSQVDVKAGGTDALNAAIDEVGTALDSVKEAAKDEVGDEVDAVQAAFDDLKDAVSGLDDPSSTALAAVSAAAADLATSTQALGDALAQECGRG